MDIGERKKDKERKIDHPTIPDSPAKMPSSPPRQEPVPAAPVPAPSTPEPNKVPAHN